MDGITYDTMYLTRGLQITSLYIWIVEDLLMQDDLVKFFLLIFLKL